jgi:phospholipid/cholesterol/gamma-HCH transport system substrate-binding protein
MILSRFARFQLVVFGLVAVLGIAYVAIKYVGLGDPFTGKYVVYAEFANSGGVFVNAPVSYRGVPVGRVTDVSLHEPGVRVALRLDGGVQVPRDLRAVVAHRSAVGEQYVDLRPNTDDAPYLKAGEVIPAAQTGLPLPIETLLSNLDRLVGSVNVDELTVLIDQLGTAFEGNEAALRLILDANSALLSEAAQRLPETSALIKDSAVVLQTQIETGSDIRRFSAALAQLTKSIREADPDLRKLLANGPPAAIELLALLRDIEPSLAPLLGNLITVNGIAVRRLNGIEQILVEYPLVVTGAFTVAPGDGTAHLGLALNANDPPSCNYYKSGQPYRCTGAELNQGSGVRSVNQAPRAGAAPSPAPLATTSPGGLGNPADMATGTSPVVPVASYDPVTGLVIGPDGVPMQLGGTGGQAAMAGAESWKVLLLP